MHRCTRVVNGYSHLHRDEGEMDKEIITGLRKRFRELAENRQRHASANLNRKLAWLTGFQRSELGQIRADLRRNSSNFDDTQSWPGTDVVSDTFSLGTLFAPLCFWGFFLVGMAKYFYLF